MLSEPGKQYAIYLFGGKLAKLSLALPEGKYAAEWVSPLTGKVLKNETITATSKLLELNSPEFETDVALRIRGK